MAAAEHLDLYHRTSPQHADQIRREGRMTSRENTGEVYLSTHVDGQAVGYGQGVVHVRVPAKLAELDDEFPSGEQHYRVNAKRLRPEYIIR